MINYKKKKRNKTIIKTGFFLYFTMLFLILIFSESGYIQLKEIQSMNEKLNREIENTIQIIEELEFEKNRLEQDLIYIEKIARSEFKMAKRGEKVFTIVSKKGNN